MNAAIDALRKNQARRPQPVLAEESPLTSLSLTHVSYNPTSTLSTLSAYLALVPQALVIVYLTAIWSTREIEILLMFAGQMTCEALNWALKRWIREERPSQMQGKGYGMPSSHAQFVAFFSTYLALFLLLRHTPLPPGHPHVSPTHTPIPYWQRLGLALLAVASAAAVAQSRVYLNYHKPNQVYIGVGAGVGFAISWFVATDVARRYGVVGWVLDHPVSRYVKLRDLVVHEDLVDAGWARWDGRRKGMGDSLVQNGSPGKGKKKQR